VEGEDKELRVRFQRLRELQYAIWLVDAFDSDWAKPANRDLLGEAIREANEQLVIPPGSSQSNLAIRIQDLQCPCVSCGEDWKSKARFRFWYTLRIDPASDLRTESSNLGTAMFFTSHPLPPDFLKAAQFLIDQHYRTYRLWESELRATEQGEAAQRAKFAHQTANAIETVWSDPARKRLSPDAHISFWMTRFLVQSVWGSVPVDGNEILCRGKRTSFPSLGKKAFVSNICSSAALAGLKRATFKPGSGESEVAQKRWEFVKERAYAGEQGLGEMYSDLGFELPRDDLFLDWGARLGVAVPLFHALWQAFFHGIEALANFKGVGLQGGDDGRPFVWVEVDSGRGQLAIRNRAALASETAGGENFDAKMMKDFEQVFAESFPLSIEGPRCVRSGEWEVVITVPE
jgi:hypothetical protein